MKAFKIAQSGPLSAAQAAQKTHETTKRKPNMLSAAQAAQKSNVIAFPFTAELSAAQAAQKCPLVLPSMRM